MGDGKTAQAGKTGVPQYVWQAQSVLTWLSAITCKSNQVSAFLEEALRERQNFHVLEFSSLLLMTNYYFKNYYLWQ